MKLTCEVDRDAPLTLCEKVAGAVGCLSPIIGILLAGLLCGGCLCISNHAHGTAKPYGATRAVSCAIAEAFVVKPEWHYGSQGEAAISHAYAMLFLPLTVIALPFEAVADTVTLPYDAFQ